MKTRFFYLLVFLIAVSISAQEKFVNEEIPKIMFSNIKWSHKEDLKVWGLDTYGTGDPMRPSTITMQKRNYFLYQVLIKNETGRTVKGFSYNLVFLKKTDGTESGRLEFSYIVPFRKNKRMSTEAFGGPPTRIVDAKDADDPTKSLNVNAEIKCVIYENNKIWR